MSRVLGNGHALVLRGAGRSNASGLPDPGRSQLEVRSGLRNRRASGTLGAIADEAAGIAQKRQRRIRCSLSIKGALCAAAPARVRIIALRTVVVVRGG